MRGAPVRKSEKMTQQLRLAPRMNGAWAFSRDIEAARRGAIQCHWENGDVIGDQNDSAVGRRATSGTTSECRQGLVTLIGRQRARAGWRVGRTAGVQTANVPELYSVDLSISACLSNALGTRARFW